MARLIDLSTLGIGERNPNAFNDPERAHGWNDLLKILEAAPTVDAVEVVRHGRWLSWDELHGGNTLAKNVLGVFCSECIRQSDSKTHFCPSCGARMDLEEV